MASTRQPSNNIFDDIIKETKYARREIEKLWQLRSNVGAFGGGIDFNKENVSDALGAPSDYLSIKIVGLGGSPGGFAISLEYDADDGSGENFGAIQLINNSSTGAPVGAIDINIYNNGDNSINIQSTGGAGIHVENDGGVDVNNSFGAGIYMEDNGDGGIVFLATGAGSGWNKGRFSVENYGGQITLRNADEGIMIYSTGAFRDDRPADLTTAIPSALFAPGMILAASDGIVFSQGGGGTNDEFFNLNYVWLYMDSGDHGFGALVSPIVLAQTTDPGFPGMLWNDSGTVKISL